MLDQYTILQSGFISESNPKLVRPNSEPSDTSFDAYILNKASLINNNIYFYHKGVESIYDDFKKDSRLLGNFGFREKAIMEFYDAVGKAFMNLWIIQQRNNPHLTELHGEFLLDMLSFVNTGVRRVQPENWELIISKDNFFNKKPYTPITSIEISKTNSFISVANSSSTNIDSFVADWISKPMGFSDFLVTIGTIFGIRTSVQTVI